MLIEAASAQVTVDQPFPGLRSFTDSEAHLFFGRDGQSDELVSKLELHRFVAITGNSGSGKSSLAKAGLIPSLSAGYLASAGTDWRFSIFRPRNAPLENLSHALAKAGLVEGTEPSTLRTNPRALTEAVTRNFANTRVPNFLILVDQFEELFRFQARLENPTTDSDEKETFVNLLLEAANEPDSPLYVAITLRSDFLGECARFRNLPENINASQYLVPRLTREQRRMAVEGPIQVAGGEIAPRLVQRVLNEIGEDPDQLPVLQHALMRVWTHWKELGADRPIDFEDYDAIGGLDAISQHADEAYIEARQCFSNQGEIVLKRLFQRLSDKDEHGRETRRPTRLGELREVCEAPLEELIQALDCFRKEGRNFLTPFTSQLRDEIEIDITHECLLRKWGRLKDWNREEESSRRAYLRIATRSEESLVSGQDMPGANGQPPSFNDFLSGVLLERSVEWWEQRGPNAIWAARYQPSEPSSPKPAERFELAKIYLEESKRRETKERKSAKWKRLANVGAVLGTAAALLILFGWMKSERYRKLADARALISYSTLASREYDAPHAGALLAARSLLTAPTVEAGMVLNSALDVLPPILQPLKDRRASSAAFSRDGKWFAVGGENGVDLYNAQDGSKERSWALPGTVQQVMFASSSALVAVTGNKIFIDSLSSANHKPVELTCTGPITDVALDRRGRTIAALCGDFNIWHAPKPEPTIENSRNAATIQAIAVDSIGSRIARVYSQPGSWGIEILRLKGAQVVSRSPVYAHEEKEGSFGSQIVRQSLPVDIKFDPVDSDVLISAEQDGTVRSWHIRDSTASPGEQARRGSTNLAGTPGDSQDPLESRMLERAPLFKMPSPATHLAFSEDGAWIVVADESGNAKIWSRDEQTEIAHLTAGSPFKSVSISRAAAHIAAVANDNSVHLWRLSGDLDKVSDASFRAGGTYLITHTLDKSTLVSSSIIDLRTGKKQSFPLPSDPQAIPLTLSLDGSLLAEVREFGPKGLVVKQFSNGEAGKAVWEGDIEGDAFYQSSFVFTPHNRYLVGPVERSKKIRLVIWDLNKSGHPIREFPVQRQDFFDFSPDDRSMFIASAKDGLRQFEISTGEEIPVSWPGHKQVSLMGVSPNGKLAEVGVSGMCGLEANGSKGGAYSAQGVARILDLASGRTRTEVRVAGCLANMGFSRDSQHLLTLNGDNTVQLWNSRTGAEEARLAHSTPVLDFDVTQDGRIAVVDKTHYTLNNWRTQDLMHDLCGRVNGGLSATEWNRFAPGQPPKEICSQPAESRPRW